MAAKDYYKGVTIQYDGDATNLSKVLGQINGELRQSQGAARALDSALKLDPEGMALIKDRAEVAAKQIKLTEDRVNYLKEALGNAKDPEVISRITRETDIAEARLKSLREQLANLNAKQSMGDTGLGKAVTAVSEFGEGLQRIGSKMSEVGDKMTMHLTAPIVAFTAATMGAAVSVDSALTDVRKTVDATEGEYQALKNAAVEYSKTNGVTAEQVLEVQALGAQLGYAKDELEMIGRVGSGMDIATDMNAEQATTDMAQFANITGMAKSESENYASTIIALGNNMATTESKTSAMAQRIAAAGSQIGMSNAEILGLAAALSSVGMEAEAGGTAISTIMSQIDKDVATGSENLTTWAATAGMSAEEFAQAWRSSPTQALTALLTNMNAAAQGGSNMSVMLENLGVSSIRQTDALKRLAGNSQLVTDAVSLATNAWRENTALTDEVASRNDSLAAKMQMLQNRVSAIMEQIGKPVADALLGILDAAQPVFDMIESGAKAFADLDESQQKLIVGAVAAAAAFGPVSSVFGRVTDDLGGLASALSTGASGVMQFTQQMASGAGVMASLESVSAGLSTTLATGLAGIGIAAAIAAVAAFAAGLMELHERLETAEKATSGLESAMGSLGDAYDKFESDTKDAVSSVNELKDKTEELTEAQAKLADEMGEGWGDLGTQEATLDAYVDEILKLSSAANASDSDMAMLADSIGKFNQITGSSLSVIDDQTGALSLNKTQLQEVADAWKRQQEIDLASQNKEQLIAKQAEAEKLLKEATDEASAAMQANASAGGYVAGAANSASAAAVGAGQSIQQLQRNYDAATAALEQANATISQGEYVFSSMEVAMAAAGVTGEQYAQLTDQQLAEIRAAFDGTIGSISAKLAEFGVMVGKTGSGAVQSAQSAADGTVKAVDTGAARALSAQKSANDAAAKEQRRANEQATREVQRAFDEEYRIQQKAYERETKELTKQLEQNVKLRQAAFDDEENALSKHHAKILKQQQKDDARENKELSKQQSAAYKALSAELSAEEDAESKSNDRKLSAQRKANDAQEKELKSALDKRVASVKSALDAEVAAARKANQAQLKSMKEAQSEATKAFKAETSARVKEMEREYEEKVRLLEANDGTSDIENRIKQLQGENDAEDRAEKERERAEKTAELRKEVTRAKSRRKRAEAEKALNDYLAQIEHENREQERKDEIARLNDRKAAIKDETAAKKAELKQQYDDQKSQYETERSEQLEREDKQREEDYERLSEYLSGQIDKRREAADLLIEQEREKASEQLEVMREQHGEQETAYKEMLDNQLTAMREAHSTRLEQLKEEQSEIAEQRREEQEERLEQIREDQATELEVMREGHAAELEQMREENSETIEAQREAQADQLQALKESQSDALQAMKDAQSDALDSLNTSLGDANTAVGAGGDTIASTVGEKANTAASKFEGGVNKMPGIAREGAKKTLQEHLAELNRLPGQVRDVTDTGGHTLRERLDAWVMPTTNATRSVRNAALRGIEGLPSDMQDVASRGNSNLTSELGRTGGVSASASSLRSAAEGPLQSLPQDLGMFGNSSSSNFDTGLANGGVNVRNTASGIAGQVSSELSSPSNSSYNWGWDLALNLNDGIVGFWNNYLLPNLENMAQTIANLLAHSKPKEGPLKDDDQWFYHLAQNLDSGLRRGAPALLGTVSDVASGVSDAMDPDVDVSWLGDAFDTFLDEMASHTDVVANSITESFTRAFDVVGEQTQTAVRDMSEMLDAAANEMTRMLDNIGQSMSARLDMNLNYMMSAASAGGTAAGGALPAGGDTIINFDLHLDGVSVSSDMDLRTLARDLAAYSAHELASTFGR